MYENIRKIGKLHAKFNIKKVKRFEIMDCKYLFGRVSAKVEILLCPHASPL